MLRYLKGTRELGLTSVLDEYGPLLRGSCDADWSGDTDDRRPTTGYASKLQERGATFSWSSKKQQTAAISTNEAEYQAMAGGSARSFLPAIVDIKFHSVEELVEDSTVELRYCPTEDMCADLLT